MSDTKQKSHLSKSQLASMERCEYAFLRRYGMDEISRPSWAMHAGSALDYAVSTDYRQKIESRANLPADDVAEIMAEDFRKRNREEETDWGSKGVTEDAAVDHLVEATRVFHAEIAEQVQPIAVQEEVRVSFAGEDWEFLGYVDVRAEAGILTNAPPGTSICIDVKATGKAGGWKDADVAAALDAPAYDLGLRAKGVKLAGFEYHIARYGSGGGRFLKAKSNQIIPVEVTEERRAGFLKVLALAKQRKDTILTSGIGMPRYGWQCGGCGYRTACQKEFGQRPPGGEGDE